MPRYTDSKKKVIPNVVIEKSWIEIPVDKGDPIHVLVHPKVADYIELLEGRVVGDAVKLPQTEQINKIEEA